MEVAAAGEILEASLMGGFCKLVPTTLNFAQEFEEWLHQMGLRPGNFKD